MEQEQTLPLGTEASSQSAALIEIARSLKKAQIEISFAETLLHKALQPDQPAVRLTDEDVDGNK